MEYTKEKKLYYLKDNKQHLFVPITDIENDDPLSMKENYVFEKLPEIVYGKILHNYQGYNPAGWWRYINVKKSNLIERS